MEDKNLVRVQHGFNTQQNNASAVLLDDAELVAKRPEKAQQLDSEKILSSENFKELNQKKVKELDHDKKLQEANIFVHKLLDEQEHVISQKKNAQTDPSNNLEDLQKVNNQEKNKSSSLLIKANATDKNEQSQSKEKNSNDNSNNHNSIEPTVDNPQNNENLSKEDLKNSTNSHLDSSDRE